jgi:hypothetical protein
MPNNERHTRARGLHGASAHFLPLRTASTQLRLSVMYLDPGAAARAAMSNAHASAPLMDLIQGGGIPLAAAIRSPSSSIAIKAHPRRVHP